jgi:superfamily II DNA/RNA helicase
VTSTEPTTTDDALAPEDVAVETIVTPTAASVQAADVTFADFAVRPEIVAALADAGITTPFPIQAMTLPVALSGHDIIGQAKTGTGKTLGFGVPLLHRVVAPDEEGFDALPAPGKPQALVIVPTRELAVQVAGDLETASKRRSVRICLLYGGRAYEPQIDMLQRGVEVVVGTPGRMIDLMNQGHLDLSRVKCVVLDEADEMLDLGFLPDVEKLLSRTPASRHTMLFSATMPGAVVAMARRYMTQPTHIRASEPDDIGQTVKNIKQVVYRAHALDKVEVLARILQAEGRGLTIVFARTKRTAAKVADELVDRGFAAGALHGDLGQGAREQALRAFRNGKVDVLVATDVAARGIDVDDVTHVVNYQCPEDEKTYLHRTGRTGRAGNKGTAVTFVDWDDVPRWGLIDKALELGFPEPQETYSSSPHLFTDLNIPAGTTGRLPRSQRTREGLGAEVLEDLGETGKRHTSGRDADRGSRDGGRGGRDGGRGGRDGGRAPRAEGDERAPRAEGEGRQRRRRGGERAAEGTEASTGPTEGSTGSTGPAEGRTEDGAAPRRRRNRRRTRSGGDQGAEQAPATEA